MEEQAQRSMEMLAHTATAQMLGRSSWDLLSRKAPAPTAMISLVKSTPKATAEQLCVVSPQPREQHLAASAFGVQ